jgi:two-component system, chemotaxis family, response regulator Rcp1
LEFSNGCTQTASIQAPEWASQSASVLSSGIAGVFGSNPNPAKAPVSVSPSLAKGKSTCSTTSIVVVEDNPTDVFLISEAIRAHHLDAQLQVFEDGEEAINLIDRIDAGEGVRCPNIMLLDINLPKADGFMVLERLRQSNNCAGISVVVMTSSIAPDDQAKAITLGANAYFRKPTDYDAFLKIGEVIREVLDNPPSRSSA